MVAPQDEEPSKLSPVSDGFREIPTIVVGGTPVHLVDEAGALHIVDQTSRSSRPIAVASINLDHIHHFPRNDLQASGSAIDWLNLIDGAPIAKQVKRVTGDAFPKLSGSDLIGPILDILARQQKRIAIVGGSPELAETLEDRFAADWPTLTYLGQWAPAREVLESPDGSNEVARELRDLQVDVVLVCLGKPRQEQWINRYGEQTGATVLLAFGAVVDFLAGSVSRALAWISNSGFEWAWRLLLEPRRLAKRYLVQGPPAYIRVRRSSELGTSA